MPESARIPDLLIEQLALGEGRVAAADLAERFGVPEGTIQDRLEELEGSTTAIIATYPEAQVRARVEKRLADRRRFLGRRRVTLGLLASTATAALLLLVWGPVLQNTAPQAPMGSDLGHHGIVRAKGHPQLFVYRQRNGMPQRLESGSQAKAGDVVQLGYAAGDARHGVVLSLDGWGQVTLHFPASTAESTELSRESTVLPYSFRLDAAPRYERFLFITAAYSLDVKALVKAARHLEGEADAPLRLADGATLVEVVLRKETTRDQVRR